ncbi:MAG: right-handed parallel beta-helix repeat-containing protein [Deltaproteobacteria bacterium]|nr:right-handed parallel beta-helix repeat-containing protein [Deltaproteobacteria bacterium]
MKTRWLRRGLRAGGVAGACLCMSILPAVSSAASFAPNLRADAPDALPGDGICATTTGWCTLRAAIEEANALPGMDEIILISGKYRLSRTLGELVITDDLQIFGGGTLQAKIFGNKPYPSGSGNRVVHVLSPANVAISNVTIRNSGTQASCGGAALVDPGATLTFHNVQLARNVSTTDGGAICNLGTLILSNVQLRRNRVNGGHGAGLYNAGTATITDMAASANRGAQLGGAMYNAGGATLTVQNSTLWRNTALRGGGVWLDSASTATLTSSTILQNFADDSGAGVYNDGTANATLLNVTLSRNKAPLGAAIGGTLTKVENVIFNASQTPTDVMAQNNCESPASVVSLGHNLDSAATCALAATGDLSNTDPLLAALRYGGGLTNTMALLPGSPAIDAGDGVDCPPTDQRGQTRIGPCDIGAVEYVP